MFPGLFPLLYLLTLYSCIPLHVKRKNLAFIVEPTCIGCGRKQFFSSIWWFTWGEFSTLIAPGTVDTSLSTKYIDWHIYL